MFSAGVLLLSGALLAWLRMSMNYGSKPIFKTEEMRAAFHPDSFVQQVLLMHVYTIVCSVEPTEIYCKATILVS